VETSRRRTAPPSPSQEPERHAEDECQKGRLNEQTSRECGRKESVADMRELSEARRRELVGSQSQPKIGVRLVFEAATELFDQRKPLTPLHGSGLCSARTVSRVPALRVLKGLAERYKPTRRTLATRA